MSQPEEQPKQIRFICCMQTMPFEIGLDEGGYLVCPEHGRRRYGWQSHRKVPKKAYPFDPDNPTYIFRPDYGKTLLQHDQDIVRELMEEDNAGHPTETSS